MHMKYAEGWPPEEMAFKQNFGGKIGFARQKQESLRMDNLGEVI